ncbi:MAG: sulfatase-like hydrolase/transferase [bacterium]|nr:sulfatase-like hydrolase/transferase [bacterium]
MADDLGYGDLGCYGATKVKTPNIDRLAQEGRRFTDAHSPCAVCTPTRYGLMTGREYWRRGNKPWRNAYLLGEVAWTLPRLFKQDGYATACIGKWHLGFCDQEPDWNGELKPGPLEAGFDYYFGTPRSHNEPPQVLVENHRVLNLDPADPITVKPPPKGVMFGTQVGGAAARFKPDELAARSAPRAVHFIEEHKDEPFFLYYATNNVHGPITPNQRFRGMSQCGVYGDFICELDWIVGEVLNTLDRLGLAENTLVVMSSDNGGVLQRETIKVGHYNNGDLLGQKTDAWEGGHRVPFLARWPKRIAPGTRCDEMLSLSDMMATCAALRGRTVTRDECPDSYNALPLILGETGARSPRPHMTIQGVYGMGLREGRWFLIPGHGSMGFSTTPGWSFPRPFEFGRGTSDYTADGKLKDDAPKGQLYDLETDPNETTNVYNDHPEIVERLTAKLEQLTKQADK